VKPSQRIVALWQSFLQQDRIMHTSAALLLVVALLATACRTMPESAPVIGPSPREPGDGSEVRLQWPRLSWSPAAGATRYRVRLVELGATQHPAFAITNNAAVLDLTTRQTSLRFPPQAPQLTPGRAYAWQVLAETAGGLLPGPVAHFRVRLPAQRVSRKDAISIIIQRHIVPPTRSDSVTAFLGRTLLQPGDILSTADHPPQARRISQPTWFAWIDDDPKAFFAHDTRYVFIHALTGRVEVMNARWWPVLNGQALWMSDAERRDPELIIYSDLHPLEFQQ
jgi:hypothetical protein